VAFLPVPSSLSVLLRFHPFSRVDRSFATTVLRCAKKSPTKWRDLSSPEVTFIAVIRLETGGEKGLFAGL